jgi:hypothetical protein
MRFVCSHNLDTHATALLSCRSFTQLVSKWQTAEFSSKIAYANDCMTTQVHGSPRLPPLIASCIVCFSSAVGDVPAFARLGRGRRATARVGRPACIASHSRAPSQHWAKHNNEPSYDTRVSNASCSRRKGLASWMLPAPATLSRIVSLRDCLLCAVRASETDGS